uniref:Large S protein n=1 Tax=Hepatitis B virus TaxID=10407 RepID=D2X4L5_HBV|nr:large S protein [Hepatitis B virus]
MGGWSSKPRQGMGTNLSVPNPLGFFPDHQLDPAFGATHTIQIGTSTPTRITGQTPIR